jgi:hypothetical protein
MGIGSITSCDGTAGRVVVFYQRVIAGFCRPDWPSAIGSRRAWRSNAVNVAVFHRGFRSV